MNNRLICVGDVHGCIDELNALLHTLALGPGDRLVFLGDLVDRGPDTPAVVRRVRGLLHEYPGSTVVLGNHEGKLAQRLNNPARLDRPAWMADIPSDELTWLTRLPPFVRHRQLGVLMVHGGVFPRYFDAHERLPESHEDVPALPRKQRERIGRFRFVRFVDEEGNMVALRDRTPGSVFWAHRYDGREGTIYFGHEPILEAPRKFDHAVGIDGACVFGGALLAAVWRGSREPEIVKQPAFGKYAELREDDLDD
jgi:diadenosine tetraphosphatase ApaH/serine/threonine PP2A family protein phosphatase